MCRSARPAEPHDLFAQVLSASRGDPCPEQVDSRQLVAEGLRQLSQDLPGSDHDPQIRCLVTDDVRKPRARTQPAPEAGQVPDHATEVQLRDSRVLPFETGCLALFDPALFDEPRDALNALVLGDESVVVIRLVDASRIRPDESLLQAAQIPLVPDETQQYAFEPGRSRVVLLVGIRRGR